MLNKLKRVVMLFLGVIFLSLGVLGYFVPGLPGTIWLIISAAFFLRSSERLYGFVINNRLFGRQVKTFYETGGMPFKAKVYSIGSIWVFSIASIIWAPYDWLFDIPIAFLAVVGTTYILKRPTVS